MHFSSCAQAFTLWRENTCSQYHCSLHSELLYLLHSNTLLCQDLWRRSNTSTCFQGLHKAKRTLAHYGWQKINSFTAKSAHHSTQQSGDDRFPMPSVCKHHWTWSLTRIHTHVCEQALRCSKMHSVTSGFMKRNIYWADSIVQRCHNSSHTQRSHTVIISHLNQIFIDSQELWQAKCDLGHFIIQYTHVWACAGWRGAVCTWPPSHTDTHYTSSGWMRSWHSTASRNTRFHRVER